MPKSHLPTALVAGAGGFVGSHLCDALVYQNCLVYGLDDWSTGKKDNLRHVLGHKNFVFLEHDLNVPLKTSLPEIDYVFHLAGIEAYVNGLDVSLDTLLVNSLGTRQLLEIARKNQAKFLLGSTIDIYSGFLSATDLNQYFSPDRHREEAYSHHEAKRFSEALTYEYFHEYQLDSRIVRLGNLYGPRQNPDAGGDMVRMIKAALTGQPLVVANQGLRVLYPTYIADVIYGLTKAMFSQSSSGQIFTLINPQKTTALNFANLVKKVVGNNDLQVEFNSDGAEIEPLALSKSVLKSQDDLGWQPKMGLEAGLKKTILWLQTQGRGVKTKTLPVQLDAASELETYSLEELGIVPALPAQPEKTIPVKTQKEPLKLKLPAMPKLPKIPQVKSWPRLNLPKLKLKRLQLKTKLWLAGAALILLWLIGPLIGSAVLAYGGVMALKQAREITDLTQTASLVRLASHAEARFNLSRQWLRRGQVLVRLLGQKSASDNYDRLLSIGANLSRGGRHLALAGESGTLLTQIVLHREEGNITEAIKRIQLNLDQAYSELSFVESELQSGRQLDQDLTSNLIQEYQVLTDELPRLRQKINQLKNVLILVPAFIAQDTKKTYLVLFQNSTEIRPTGGFIGSYGLLTFEKGKLLDFAVEDIYAADGQLKGFVEPPAPIKEFLGQNTWFFRDSNWDPDFVVSAERAEWFLQKTTNRSVDGTIAVNLPAVKFLLEATGPINLPDYNEEVSADNLFDRAEYRAEIDFFPGSTQKKDFLGSLGREIFNRLQKASAGELIKLAEAGEQALAQKQILVSLHDEYSQKQLIKQNWAGSLFAPTLSAPDQRPVTSDYNFLVEANLGINKANYFLTRSVKHQLTLLKNKEILAVTTINYQNRSPADAWPGGVYKTYLRQYLPAGSSLVSVKIDDNRLDLSQAVDTEAAEDKFILGFPVSVGVKSAAEVEITYRLSNSLVNKNSYSRLAVVMPKQPGIINDPLEVIVNHPTFLSVAAVSPQALIAPQVVTWKSDFSFDRVFTIDFIEK